MREEIPFSLIAPDVRLGRDVFIVGFVNLYGCSIGDQTTVGPFVEIGEGVSVGARCKIGSHTYICPGVTLEEGVFVGHGVMFTNDRHPRATNERGVLATDSDWVMERTLVRRNVSIGSGAVILPGVEIGEGAVVGAGAVVTRDVDPLRTVVGSPARVIQ